MDPRYRLNDVSQLLSPGLIVFRDLVVENIKQMLKMSGGADRLRPHCKTHKMAEVTKIELDMGITKHKAATIAEAEMLAAAGAPDVMIAYPIVGPNIGRVAKLIHKFPGTKFSVVADHILPLKALGQAMEAISLKVAVFLEINPGRDRTGVPIGPAAKELYQELCKTPGLIPAGLHVYDGHVVDPAFASRDAVIRSHWDNVLKFKKDLIESGCPVPTIVCGGSPQFGVYSHIEAEGVELSPGTCVLHDAGYDKFPEMQCFTPAALVLTRVISRPTPTRITFDVGNKAIASDPPIGQRLVLPDLPDAVQVLHNEEHLVVETPLADRWTPGDWTLAIPKHICPTSAVHKFAYVASEGRIIGEWEVTSRDRRLTI
jgi:D-serine deaminase-like pyridoxal phosphate-dependent protein